MSTTAKKLIWIIVAVVFLGLAVRFGNVSRSRPMAAAKHSADEQSKPLPQPS